MAVSPVSSYKIQINTDADTGGIDKAKAGFASLQSQLKNLESDIEQAQRSGVAVPQSALDSVDKLKRSISEYGHALEQPEIKTLELKEALHVVGAAAGEALGPLGELGHFLGNPYILAAFGSVAAIKMLVEQHQQLRAELEKNIEATREIHDAFANNFTAAVHHVTEAVAEFHRVMTKAGEVQNEFASRLAEQTALINQQAQAVTSLAQARQQLYDANIQGAELTGQLTGPEGYAAEQHARQQERQQAEQAEREAHTREVAEQRRQADEAAADAATAESQATSQTRTDQRIRNDAAVQDAQDEVTRRKDTAKTLGDSVIKTASESGVDKITDDATYKAMKAKLDQLEKEASSPDLSESGVNAAASEAAAIRESVKQYEALKRAQDDVTTAEKHLSEIKIKAADYEAETAALQSRAATLKTFAETTGRAAAAAERLNAATEAAHGAIDQTQDATERQKRLNYLLQRGKAGQLTPDEEAEAEGALSKNPQQAIRDTTQKIRGIETNIRINEGGHVSADEFRQLQLLNDRILGLIENILNPGGQSTSTLDSLSARVSALEGTVQNHDSRMRQGPYPQ